MWEHWISALNFDGCLQEPPQRGSRIGEARSDDELRWRCAWVVGLIAYLGTEAPTSEKIEDKNGRRKGDRISCQ